MTCGSDCDVRMFVGLEDNNVSEFSVSSSRLTGLVCYTAPAEREEEEGAGVMLLPWQWTTILYRHSLLMKASD